MSLSNFFRLERMFLLSPVGSGATTTVPITTATATPTSGGSSSSSSSSNNNNNNNNNYRNTFPAASDAEGKAGLPTEAAGEEASEYKSVK